MKLDILAIGVHPDDIELSCCGTLLRHIHLGYKVGLCDLTMGELGSRGNGQLRLQEAEESRKKMGALVRENLGMADGFFEHSKSNILSISKVIRKYQPEIVLANALADRHPDHGRAAQLISEACFYSGLVKIEQQDDNNQQLAPWRPRAVYHYVQDRNIEPDFLVDISEYFEKKMELILTFASQFYTGDDDEGPQTPISGKYFMDYMKAKNRSYGRDINAEYAEAFNLNRIPGVNDLFDLK